MSGDPRGPFFVTQWEREEYERERASARTIWHIVADLKEPAAEPFVVLRVDTSVRRGTGVEGTVISTHRNRVVAEITAERLDREYAVTSRMEN